MQAHVVLLTGCHHVSRRVAVRILKDLAGVDISLGSIKDIEDRVSQALAEPYQEAEQYVRQAPVVHSDETGWLVKYGKQCLWATVAPKVTVYHIDPRHNAEMVRELLGQDFKGIVISDRHVIYAGVPVEQRQVCHAHLDRDFEKIRDRGGASADIGQAGMELEDAMFKHWHRFKAGEMDRPRLQQDMQPVQVDMKKLLTQGSVCGDSKTQNTCKNLLDLWPAFWKFVEVKGVEPTNNAAEQALRSWVIWRKLTFGTRTDAGSRYAERIMTVAESCRRQKRSLLDFLADSIAAFLLGQPGPSLVPDPGG